MIKVEVTTKPLANRHGEISAWINLPDAELAHAATLSGLPGWDDAERRAKLGAIGGAYLTASAPALLVLPAAAAKYHAGAEKVRILAAHALAVAEDRRASALTILLDGPAGGAAAAADAAEGLALHDYRFDKYKKKGEPAPAISVRLLVTPEAEKEARAAVKDRLALCGSINSARDLVNEPGSVMTPETVEREARRVAKAGGLGIEVLDAKQLGKEGYEGLLAVGRGGEVPPRMIILSYKPKDSKDSKDGKDSRDKKGKKAGGDGKIHLGFLGKGVTFDTGGVSIKPADKMWQMKGDMGGAAAVLYGMEAIARTKPNIRVTAIIVTAQNYVDAMSIVPGDVIKGRNGKFIHVDNTDAEGRLILSDGLWRAGEEKVTHLVDIATLTGAIVRAIGSSLVGAFGNDGFVDKVMEVAAAVGEPCWKMPLHEEYMELIKTDVADVNNVGSRPEAGAITAALFLREFLPEGISWTHLDIAGPFIMSGKWKYYRPGATGIMTRTVAALAAAMQG